MRGHYHIDRLCSHVHVILAGPECFIETDEDNCINE